MTAYAIGVISKTTLNHEIEEYLRAIDATLRPFDGRYLVHGGPYQVLEGEWCADAVVLQFPSMRHARSWYDSEAYGRIRALRQRNTEGTVLLVEGVSRHHRGARLLSPLQRQWAGYGRAHRSKANLLIHACTVPVFMAGTALAIAGVLGLSLSLVVAGLACMGMAVVLQGIGHGREANRPAPFASGRDAVVRIFLEQWVTFPRYLLSGGWRRAAEDRSGEA